MANKGKMIVDAALTRKGKNQYSQDMTKRYMIENGYGDCSATIRHWYKKILGIDIGLNTEAQLKSKLGRVVDLKIINGVPDESKMQLGDCLMFRGKNNYRHLGVGHIEMYIGDGKCFGHGSGIGGTVKDMKDYCIKRQKNKSTPLLKNTGLICIIRFIEDEVIIIKSTKPTLTKPSSDWVKRLQTTLNKLGYKDENGKTLNVDGKGGKLTRSALPSLKKGDKNELVGLAQERLKELGFYDDKIDNSFGNNSANAVVEMKNAFMGTTDPTTTLGTKSWLVLLGIYED